MLKPDLWDLQIKHALREAIAHDCPFIDPCPVGRTADHGNIEPFVRVTRDRSCMLKELTDERFETPGVKCASVHARNQLVNIPTIR